MFISDMEWDANKTGAGEYVKTHMGFENPPWSFNFQTGMNIVIIEMQTPAP